MQDYEKLGVFYLGRVFDAQAGKGTDDLVLYDSRDLTTHAVCVGMTGSGKTGLCIALLEEAALDGIPSLVIDPKGDLGNLLLTFPDLRPEDFRPWINEDDARRKGLSPDEFAAQQAETWKKGLEQWGESGERIRRLREAAEFAIYTPGSRSGLPLSVVASFAAPPPSVLEDGDLLRQRVATTATSLLGLVGIDADPIQSREHILLSNLFERAWSAGEDLDLGMLIARIQKPPLERVGVMDLESFYPAKERFALAMALNNLLASPSFGAWLEGEPLDLKTLLYTPAGKPRVAIVSIAHLGDAERMFIVSLLLNQALGWVRGLAGTTSLRALIYMDEVFGYLPPVANPPSKLPLLTLLKQARAFGVGVVLATQNPVDLDYKALSNTGTWLLGRLQTERDKQRVLDGLESASGGAKLDRAELDRLLSGLKSRVFLMQNVHDSSPELIESRWAMSYLSGPLTLQQIKSLTPGERTASRRAAAAPASPAPAAAKGGRGSRPVLPPQVPQVFLPLRRPSAAGLEYRPALLGMARVHFRDSKLSVDGSEEASLLAPLGDLTLDWQAGETVEVAEADLEREPAESATFAALPAKATDPKSYDAWSKSFAEAVYRTRALGLWRSPSTKLVSRPGESEGEFRVRLAEVARETRDELKEAIRQRYGAKVDQLQQRLLRAQERVEREKNQASAQKMQTAISMGSTILGALFGRKRLSTSTLGRATTAARGVGRVLREGEDVDRAQDSAESLQQQIADLNAQMESEVKTQEAQSDPRSETLEEVSVKPRKADIEVRLVSLAWAPYLPGKGGNAEPAW
jgi:hypothetical protein